jgi:tetratricopeptide (TPR) repeat protein
LLTAAELHRTGRLAEAELLCLQALRDAPDDFDLLYLLGRILAQTGRTEHAAEMLARAVASRGDVAAVHLELANLLAGLRRFEPALAHFDMATRLQPDLVAAHNNRGTVLQTVRRLPEALGSYDAAIALQPDYLLAHINRGNVLRDLGRSADALASYDLALSLRPDHARTHLNRSAALRDLHRLEEALPSCERALALYPGLAEAHLQRGHILRDLRRHADALASYDRTIALRPDDHVAHNGRGAALLELQRLAEALPSIEKAIALRPDYVYAHMNCANALLGLGRTEDALGSFERAMALDPTRADACWLAGTCDLKLGQYERGWRRYEQRVNDPLLKLPQGFAQALWRGIEPIADKTVLLYAEQGLGDALQFCRYARLVAERGAKVILTVPRALVRLLTSLDGAVAVVAPEDPLPRFDYCCSLMSLPFVFNTTVSTVPARVPYLRAGQDDLLRWKEKLGGTNRLRVGLAWSGGFRAGQPDTWAVNQRRNAPLESFAPLRHPDVEFYSLQKGEPAESELAAARSKGWSGPALIDHTGQLRDFADTAALVEQLDLVICVDTSVAHLAGALGKPVWILNRFDGCWRWLCGRDDTPWYPSARLFRQETPGDWDGVVARVKADLVALVSACQVRSGREMRNSDSASIGARFR